MEIIVIILAIIDIGLSTYLVYLMRPKKEITPKVLPKVLNDKEKKKQEELRKNFENLMGYGYDDALKKKE